MTWAEGRQKAKERVVDPLGTDVDSSVASRIQNDGPFGGVVNSPKLQSERLIGYERPFAKQEDDGEWNEIGGPVCTGVCECDEGFHRWYMKLFRNKSCSPSIQSTSLLYTLPYCFIAYCHVDNITNIAAACIRLNGLEITSSYCIQRRRWAFYISEYNFNTISTGPPQSQTRPSASSSDLCYGTPNPTSSRSASRFEHQQTQRSHTSPCHQI